MASRRLLILGAAFVVLSLAIIVCGPRTGSGSPDKGLKSEPTGEAADVAARARSDLATRLEVPPEQIVVESVRAHTWSDASLGLREPGMMYAQVLTSGHIVTLRFAGRSYVYHVAGQTVKLNPDAG